MAIFNIETDTAKEIDKLYNLHAIESKESFVLLGMAVGIAIDRKKKLKSPKPFHTLQEMDPTKAFALIATTRNDGIYREDDVARELEEYTEAGLDELFTKHVKDGAINHYQVYRRYAEP